MRGLIDGFCLMEISSRLEMFFWKDHRSLANLELITYTKTIDVYY